MKVEEAHRRLKAALGARAADPPLEGLVAGPGDAEVTGVAACYAPSVAVLAQAKRAGCNLLLADAHPYYLYDRGWDGRGDLQATLAASPGVAAKRATIERDGIAILRFKSAWDAAFPAAGATALAGRFGWTATASGDFALCTVPAATLGALARSIAGQRVGGVRLIGDDAVPVSRLAVANGIASPEKLGRMLRDPAVGAVVAGEVIEWEGGPYMQDLIATGRRAGLICTGFATSQEPLADAMARWAQGVLPGVPVRALHDREDVWSPMGAAR